MFKDISDGKTHYYGDGCGIKEHNMHEKLKQVLEELAKNPKE